MKKSILVFALFLALASCEKSADQKVFKTAYVDTSLLMEEYTEAKDIEAKYKTKGEEMGKQLEAEVARFRTEASSFQKNAQTYGPQWAQQKGAELQKKEQELTYAQQAILRQLQEESGKEMDTLVKDVKKFIKDYGKEKGYDYIYGTGDAASVLYAKDEFDVTKEMIKLLNDKYKSTSTSEAKKEDNTTAKKEEK
ncbi:OmpH family outer membrane protein [Flavobacterium sp.]|uniref:OmpH family outer membrane protein n=1 Tax=Flavobacterium sp. TaxID=239 RepID=UPI00260BE91E|nr:OmpH family outer membrane protein [Flavobacterium sp.]MDD2984880.1 OmpH family outer membrane protein [Flavobacterium sp.]